MINYINGNTHVTIMDDGTKVRVYDDIPKVVHPESIDVKITNYCDMGCSYCHESSNIKGNHADLYKLLDVIFDLPSGVELAIGGGNPLSHPMFREFLVILKTRGIIANVTINQGHLYRYKDLIIDLVNSDLVKGVGISITSTNFDVIKPILDITDNVVYHLIAGVNDIKVIDSLIGLGKCKVLILGYKRFGLGINHYSPSIELNLKKWYQHLPQYVGKCTMSFDNLAIEQLNIRRLFTDSGWDKFYMGDDFCFTMYVDAVNQEYAPTSRSNDRVSFDGCSLLDYFNKNKNVIK